MTNDFENSGQVTTSPLTQPITQNIVDAVLSWQAGQTSREAVVALLTALETEQGAVISDVVRRLSEWVRQAPQQASTAEVDPQAQDSQPHKDSQQGTENWRNELMSSRAKAWAYPHSAGMLVSPETVILTDGQYGVILQAQHIRALSSSTSGSLMLLCQTIVMAQNAVDASEMEHLRQQRIDSTSTSLSEIEPIG